MLLFILGISGFVILYTRISNLEAKLETAVREKKLPTLSPQIPLSPQIISTIAEENQSIPIPPTPITLDPLSISLPRPDKKANDQTEFAVGGKIFTGIGVLAIFLAVGFFLRYAFENNLISETMRVVFGGIFGLIVAGVGHFLRKKYASYGETLIGAGVGILYLSTYAAYGFYKLIDWPVAFFILFCITGLSVITALLYNSKNLVIWSLVGAFLIPFILPMNTSVHLLFTYLLIINSGILLIARFKVWPEIAIGSLMATSLIYLKWVFGPYTEVVFIPTLVYSTALFAIYFLTSLFNFIFRTKNYQGVDAVLLYTIPVVYFLLNLNIVTGKEKVALFALSIGLFYLIVSTLVRAALANLGELRKFSNAMLFIAGPFIMMAIGLHFEGSTITILWAAQAVIMALAGYLLNSPANRVAGLILSMFVAVKFVVNETRIYDGAQLIFNARSVTILALVLMFVILWKLYLSYISRLDTASPDEKTAGKFIGAAGVFLTIFLWLGLEANDFVEDYTLYLPIIWYSFSAVMISLSFIIHDRTIRYFSYGSMFLGLIFTAIFQWHLDPSTQASFLNVRTLTMLIVVCSHIYILRLWKLYRTDLHEQEEKTIGAPLLLTANGIVFWAISLEILQYFNKISSFENTKRIVLSAFWLIYALASLAAGIIKRSHFARYFSIIIFGVTIFKIFLYDTANLNDIYRFVSFIILGFILLIAGFAYHKYKNRIAEFVSVAD